MWLSPKYLPRLSATVGLFTRYGLADFAKQQGLHSLALEVGETGGHDEAPEHDGASPERAAAFRKRLVELGPAYIKLGQVMSTRPDLLPPPYIAELEKLQDEVAAIAFTDVQRTVEEELGGRLSKLFSTFDVEPLGVASLGQVHAAQLRDERDVVVKVQRPGIREQLTDDVAFFNQLARFLTDHTDAGGRVDLVSVIDQLERALADELDYRIEARNVATFRRSLAEFPRILVPRVVEAYSTARVLTTERIFGVKIADVSPITRLEHDFEPVAEELTRAYLKMVTIDGHFHADPHPGNVFIVMPTTANPLTPAQVAGNERRERERPAVTALSKVEHQAVKKAQPEPADIDVRLALIDFGMTAKLSASLREVIARLLLAVADNRGDEAAELLIEIGEPLPGFDRRAFSREAAAILARDVDLTVGELDVGKVLFQLVDTSFRNRLRVPAELTLLAKAMFNLDAITRALQTSYSPIPTMREFAGQIIADRAKRDLSPRRMIQLVAEGTEVALALPRRLDIITRRLANNDFEWKHDVPQLTLLMEALQKVANRIFSGVVLAGLLIASAMLLPSRRMLGTIGFIIAGAVGIWMVLSIAWTDRDRT